jgi:flagellar biosynthesis/type III secretory pathway chaperone
VKSKHCSIPNHERSEAARAHRDPADPPCAHTPRGNRGAEKLSDGTRAERRALHSNDPAAIEAAVTEKNRIADQLQGFERQKLRVVASTVAGAESEQKAVLTAWQRLPPLADAWHAVCQLARQCQERNQENGVLLREKQHFVQQALDVLLHSQERLNIYDDKGQSRLTLTGHSRKIGSA